MSRGGRLLLVLWRLRLQRFLHLSGLCDQLGARPAHARVRARASHRDVTRVWNASAIHATATREETEEECHVPGTRRWFAAPRSRASAGAPPHTDRPSAQARARRRHRAGVAQPGSSDHARAGAGPRVLAWAVVLGMGARDATGRDKELNVNGRQTPASPCRPRNPARLLAGKSDISLPNSVGLPGPALFGSF